MTIFTASLLHSISKVENEDPEMFQTLHLIVSVLKVMNPRYCIQIINGNM